MDKCLIAAGLGKYYTFEFTWLSLDWINEICCSLSVRSAVQSSIRNKSKSRLPLCEDIGQCRQGWDVEQGWFFSQINVEPCPWASLFSVAQMWGFVWFNQCVVRLLTERALMQIIIWYSGYNYGYSDFHLPLLTTQHARQNTIGTDTWAASAKRALA